MASYHLNPTTGDPGPCRAKAGNCPFAPAGEHYGSKEAARQTFESKMQLAEAKPTAAIQFQRHTAALQALDGSVTQGIEALGGRFSQRGSELRRQWDYISHLLNSYYGKEDTYEGRRSYALGMSDHLHRLSQDFTNHKPLYLAGRLKELGEALHRESGPTRLY